MSAFICMCGLCRCERAEARVTFLTAGEMENTTNDDRYDMIQTDTRKYKRIYVVSVQSSG